MKPQYIEWRGTKTSKKSGTTKRSGLDYGKEEKIGNNDTWLANGREENVQKERLISSHKSLIVMGKKKRTRCLSCMEMYWMLSYKK